MVDRPKETLKDVLNRLGIKETSQDALVVKQNLYNVAQYKNPSPKYQQLIDNGYIEKGSFEAGSYELSDDGVKRLKELRSILTKDNGDMFGASDITEKLNEAKTLINENQKDIKENKVRKQR